MGGPGSVPRTLPPHRTQSTARSGPRGAGAPLAELRSLEPRCPPGPRPLPRPPSPSARTAGLPPRTDLLGVPAPLAPGPAPAASRLPSPRSARAARHRHRPGPGTGRGRGRGRGRRRPAPRPPRCGGEAAVGGAGAAPPPHRYRVPGPAPPERGEPRPPPGPTRGWAARPLCLPCTPAAAEPEEAAAPALGAGSGRELPAERLGAGSARLGLFLGVRLCPPHPLGLLGVAAPCVLRASGAGLRGHQPGRWGTPRVSPLSGRGRWVCAFETSTPLAKPLPLMKHCSDAWRGW